MVVFFYSSLKQHPANMTTFCVVHCFLTTILCVAYRCPHLVRAVRKHSKHPATTSTRLQFSVTYGPHPPGKQVKTPWRFGQGLWRELEGVSSVNCSWGWLQW